MNWRHLLLRTVVLSMLILAGGVLWATAPPVGQDVGQETGQPTGQDPAGGNATGGQDEGVTLTVEEGELTVVDENAGCDLPRVRHG